MNNNINEKLAGAPAAPKINPQAAARADKDFNATAGATGQTNAPAATSILSLLRSAASASAMSEEGTKYIQSVIEKVQAVDAKHIIKVVQLTDPAQAHAFVAGDKAVVLVFAEAIQVDPNKPVVVKTVDAGRSLSLIAPNTRIISSLVITKADYTKAAVMGAYIHNVLSAANDANVQGTFSLASFDRFNLEISTIPQVYDQFMESNYPHGVMPRADLKLTISLVNPVNNKNTNQLFEATEPERIPVATVGAYVNFSRFGGNGFSNQDVKYIPEIHISSIVSKIWHENILPLVWTEAVNVLINNKFWVTPFNPTGSDENSPNIGKLIIDPATNASWKCENTAQRDQFIGRYCTAPILCVDVVEGLARVPGLEKYTIPGWFPQLATSLNTFTNGATNLPTTVELAKVMCLEYTGTIKSVGAQEADSRWISFLNEMIHHESQRAQCEDLLAHATSPADDLVIKRRFENDINVLYLNTIITLEPQVVNAISECVHNRVRVINGERVSGTVDMSTYATMGNSYAQSGRQYYQASVNPFASYLGPNQPLF